MPARRPNLVILFADDLGIGDVGAYNPDSRIPTPHMDRIAREGCRFTDAHSSSAVCTPSRYSILTGRNCWRTRLKDGVLYGGDRPLIEAKRPTMASMLRNAGYRTWCVGKWHLGLGWHEQGVAVPTDPTAAVDVERIDYARPLWHGPNDLGFDHSYIIPASLDMAPYVYLANGQVVEAPTARAEDSERPSFWRGGPRAPGFTHETCLLELTTHAEALIDQHARSTPEQPFFLYLPQPSPHTPHVPRPPFQGTSQAGVYGDFVVEHDWSIGRILAALERNGLLDDTIVVLSSDNGAHSEPLGLEAAYGHACNAHYRGQKSDAWDGGHRVPLCIRWPRGIRASTVCDALVTLNDLVPMAATIANTTVPLGAAEDAVDCCPLFADPQATIRQHAMHHSIDGRFAVRDGTWKLIGCRGSGGWSLREADAQHLPQLQLYDLANDVRETRNLVADHPQRVQAMLAALVAAGGPALSC